MTPDIEKIEHLLNAKAFEELNAAERELVLAHLSGSAEYEHMRETLVRVKKVFVAEAASLAVDGDLKEQILNRFEQNKTRHPSLSERVATFFQTLIPSPAGRFAGALAVVLVVVSVGFFVWPKQQPEMAQQLLPPATEPQVVTLMDNTPPPIALAMEKAKTATPPAESIELTGSTQTEPDLVSYGVVARADQDEFIVAGLADGKELYNKDAQNATEDLKSPERGKSIDTEEQAPPVFLNQDGLYQYQNSRVADAGVKRDDHYSDAFKNYTPPVNAKKAEAESRVQEKKASVPQKPNAAAGSAYVREEESMTVAESRKQKSNTDATGALYEDISIASKTAPASPVPVWPGVEDQTNPYTATLESVKAFFNKETGMAYRIGSQEYQNSKMARLSLTFNAKGIITKVHVSGDVNEAQKKAFIQRALQLPAFRFTPGGGKPLLEQTYVLELY